jgi:hypothetical protein
MARKLRIQYPGAIYHVMKRVDRLLAEWSIARDSAAGRRVFGERTEGRRGEDTSEELKALSCADAWGVKPSGRSCWRR